MESIAPKAKEAAHEVTRLLEDAARGQSHAGEALLPLIYEELRKRAAHRMANEHMGHTLQATALVHEAYLRLVGDRDFPWANRAHFFVAAAEAMRRILIEHARAKKGPRRGGGRRKLPLNIMDLATTDDPEADFREAISILAQIQVASPEDGSATISFTDSKALLAEMLTEIGRAPEAEKLLHEAIVEVEPIAQRNSRYMVMVAHLAPLYELLGNSLFSQERFAEAHEAYVKAQSIRRENYETHSDAPSWIGAMVYLLVVCPDQSVRDPAIAAGILRTALQRTPHIQALWGYLGASLYQMGDWQGAIDALEKAQQLGTRELGSMRYVLALAQFKSGRPELARASLAQAEQWAAITPVRYRAPRIFAPEARQVILGSSAPPPASTSPATRPAESASQP